MYHTNPRSLKNTPILPPPLPARPRKPNHQDEQKSYENELNDGSEDEDTYEAPPTERPLRTATTIGLANNNDYIEKPASAKPPAFLPKPRHMMLEYLPKVQNKKSDSEPANMYGLYIDPNIAKGSGSKCLPNPRSQPPIPLRGATLPTPVTKPLVPIGKPLLQKPSFSSEEMPIPPSTGKRACNNQMKFNLLVPSPFTQSSSRSIFDCSVPIQSMQKGSQGTRRTGLTSSPSILAENINLLSRSWYASKCDRKTAEAVLHENSKDGAFLVRPSSGCGRNQPYTLAVLHRRKVYNIPIRLTESSNQYVLGKEKAGEMWFDSVQGMIDYYQQNTLILIDQQNNTKDSILLLYPVQL
ncbi:B-cell linker protein-like [Mustelus asterias]